MKKIFLFFAALLTAMMVNAGTVTFDFTTAESITAMGLDLPEADVGTNLENKVIRVGDIAITSTKNATTDNRLWLKTVSGVSSYELRLYNGNTLTLTAATGVSILGIEIQATHLNLDGWTTNTQLYDTVTTVTLTPTSSQNHINQIIVITTGQSSGVESSTDTIQYDRTISVTNALEIGSLLASGESTSLVYNIMGYVSNVETSAEAYARWGDQTFWITDDSLSTATGNAQGALHVYQGVSPVAVKEGDKISVISAIRKYSSTGVIETVNKVPVTILEAGEDIPQDTMPVVIPDTIPTVNKDEVPSNAVLADYYNQGEVCVCFFVPAEMNCNNIVVVGSFNGWNTTPSECAQVQPVEGYDGWYVCSFEPEAEPDATKGILAKPVMLDEDGNFNWEYQIGAATAVRGGVQVVQGSFAGEIDLINYGTDAPNVFQLNGWKNNPCTAIYHNYTVTVISDGCSGYAVPYLIGGMNDWTFQKMELDEGKTVEYAAPTYTISFKAAEGTPYQILSGIIDPQTGDIEIQPYWNDDSYMQKLVDDLWGRIPGEDGDNQLTHEDANIVWDLRAEDLRWARCAPVENLEYVKLQVKLPTANAPEAVEIIGTFDDWLGTAMTLENGYYVASFEAKPSQYFKFRSAGSWDQALEVYREDNEMWTIMLDNEFVFSQLWEDGTCTDGPCKTIVLDLSNADKYRWSGAEQTEYTYTIKVTIPACGAEAPVLLGSFNDWDLTTAIPMTQVGDYTYSCTVEALETDQFKVTGSIHGWGNQILVYNDTTDLWEGTPNLVFGNNSDDQKNIVLDFSDQDRYRFSMCKPNASVYKLVLFDPACSENPEFVPNVYLWKWDMTGNVESEGSYPMSRGLFEGRSAWLLTIAANPDNEVFEFAEGHNGLGNRFEVYDAATGYWMGMGGENFPRRMEDTTLVVCDYSDANHYRYALCDKLDYDSISSYDITVYVKVPTGAPACVELAGDFGGIDTWNNGIQMKYANGIYSAQLTVKESTQFKIRGCGSFNNEIVYTTGVSLSNFVFGDFLDKTKTKAYVDYTSPSIYTWKINNPNPDVPASNFTVNYTDKNADMIDTEIISLNLPEAPEFDGFTFVKWTVVAGDLIYGINIQAVYEYNGGNPADAPEVVTNPKNKAQKLIREGNVYVLYGDKTYTLTGQEVK